MEGEEEGVLGLVAVRRLVVLVVWARRCALLPCPRRVLLACPRRALLACPRRALLPCSRRALLPCSRRLVVACRRRFVVAVTGGRPFVFVLGRSSLFGWFGLSLALGVVSLLVWGWHSFNGRRGGGI